ncbi:MAG: cyd operon YbgE family protein [Sphingomonadaceae bacterium]
MTPSADAGRPVSQLHLPSLLVAVLLMLVATLYPPLMTDASGRVDHGLAAALFMAMSAGFVRGVGYVPAWWLWRWLFSGWTCVAALLLAGWVKFLH